MKFKVIYIVLASALVTGCNNKSTEKTGGSNPDHTIDSTLSNLDKKVHVDDFSLVEPIKKIIYYMNEIDINTYDSINTQYFHEIVDYTDSAAILLENQINYLETVIAADTITDIEKKEAKLEITYLNLELVKYTKSVTGYVFVHTFTNKNDTLSAIIITNADMSKGEAFPINTITEIEPHHYKIKVRQIES